MKLKQIEPLNESLPAYVVKTLATALVGLITNLVVGAIKKHGEEFMIDIIVNCTTKSDNKILKAIEKLAFKYKSYDKGTISKKGDACEMVFYFEDEADLKDFKNKIQSIRKDLLKSVKTSTVKKN